MAAIQPALPVLPHDILLSIFSFVDKRADIFALMLVCRAWYPIAERLQYSDITLKFPLFANDDTEHSLAVRCLSTITSRDSVAHAVRHLTVSGTLTDDISTILLVAFSKTIRLISLDLQCDRRGGDDTFYTAWQASCLSDGFLPQLTALNTNNIATAISVAPGRPLSVLGVPTRIDTVAFRGIVDALRTTAESVSHLRLYIEIDDISSAAEIFRSVCRTFPSLGVLALQLRLPNAGDVTWSTIEVLLDETELSLSHLHGLKTLGLAVLPDPIDHNSQYEEKTRNLARVAVERLPSLHRVELRWHGWIISEGSWIPIHHRNLLRQPDIWLYARMRHRPDFARRAIS